jgi:hypothetical protein
MNNLQLYLSIGIPTFAVLLAWLSNKADIRDSENRLSSKIDKVDSRIDVLRAEMNGLCKEIYEALIPLHKRMAKLEAGN